MSTKRIAFALVSNRDSKLYAMGGYNPLSRELYTTETYDIETNTWTTFAPMKLKIKQLDAAVIRHTMFVCGGFYDGDTYKQCQYYLAGKDEWQLIKDSMITERRELALVANDDYLYAIGGNSQVVANETTMERWDLLNNGWTQVEKLTSPRSAFGASSLLGKIYVCGGWGLQGDSSDGKSCDRYDPETDEWQPIAPMLSKRRAFKLVTLDDKLYALGGFMDHELTNTVEVYDYELNQWQYTKPLPEKLADFAATVA
ncbi:kelch-like protein 17 [Oppia nitens]|uniref:kelch-like protein 17 n=1 Tax=Oppia nitens TaxID=1686743 RepID=UPI0023DADE74|nr:kelch-like protein 17 [Oppia nitens]